MSVQRVWNNKEQRQDWIDLSYILHKTDTPDLRHGKPVEEGSNVIASLQHRMFSEKLEREFWNWFD